MYLADAIYSSIYGVQYHVVRTSINAEFSILFVELASRRGKYSKRVLFIKYCLLHLDLHTALRSVPIYRLYTRVRVFTRHKRHK